MFSVVPAKLYGTSTIGVYMATNNRYTFIPIDAPEKVEDLVRESLGTDIVRVALAGSPLLGLFMVVNDNGILVPSIVAEEEVRTLKLTGLNVGVLKTRYTAIANLTLTNNRTALVSPLMEAEWRHVISDVLGVEVISDYLCGSPLVGSLSVANNKGILLSPEAANEDIEKVRAYFKNSKVDVATVNKGRSVLKGGIVANDRRALVGDETTGIEIMRIMQVLGAQQ